MLLLFLAVVRLCCSAALYKGLWQTVCPHCLSALVTEFGKECKKCKRLRKNMATKKAELSGTVGS